MQCQPGQRGDPRPRGTDVNKVDVNQVDCTIGKNCAHAEKGESFSFPISPCLAWLAVAHSKCLQENAFTVDAWNKTVSSLATAIGSVAICRVCPCSRPSSSHHADLGSRSIPRALGEDMVFGMVLEGRQLEYVNPLGPAFLNRLQAGDVIIAVDGEMLPHT